MNSISKASITKTLLLLGALALLPLVAFSGTVILSTTTFPGADEAGIDAEALPEVGVFNFDVVVTSSKTGEIPIVDLYLQQVGISGVALYTIVNTTITQCTTDPCTRFIIPDVFLGGKVRARFTVSGSSANITVTARQVSP